MGLLVEREREVAALRAVVAGAALGRGGSAVVLGPPGIGKSALLREATGPALRARGGELEREFPDGVVRQLFEDTVRRLDDAGREAVFAGPARPAAAVLLAGPDTGAPGDAFAVEHACFWVTVHLAERHPVVLTVDDAQWADLASLRVLLYLARRTAELPVALVVASRPGEGVHRAVIDRLAAEASEVLEPEPLTPTGVRTLVRRDLPRVDDDFCTACHAASGGNPFLVSELVAAAGSTAGGSTTGGPAAPGVPGAAGVPGVARSVLLRLDAVSPAAVALAHTLAVLGPTHDDRLPAELAGVPRVAGPAGGDDVRTALAQLRAAHLLEPDDPPRFVHSLVRDAVRADLPAAELSRLHHACARALARTGAAPETVAGHLLGVAPAADPWVVDQLVVAASGPGAAAAPEAAAAYLDRALREGAPDVDPVPLLLALGGAQYQTVGGDAASPFAEARRLARTPELQVTATCALASAYMTESRVATAWSVVEESLVALADHPDRVLDLEVFSAQLLYADVPPDWVATLRRRTRSWRPDPTGAGSRDRSMLALQAWTTACEATDVAAAARMARAALSTGTLVHDDVWYVSVDLAVWSLVMAGCYDEALDHLDSAIESCRRRGRRLRAATLLPARAELLRRLGRLAEASEDAAAAVEVVAADQIYAPQAAAAHVLVQLDRGDGPAAWAVLEGYGFDVDIPAEGMAHPLWFACGCLRLAGGDLTGGVDDLLAYGEVSERMGRRHPGLQPWRATVVEPLVQLGRQDEATTLAEQDVALAEATGVIEARGRARLALGSVTAGGARTAALTAATELLDAGRFPLDAATAHLALGRLLRREGHRNDAREHLRTAADVGSRIGAVAVARAAREELVLTGARPRRAAATGVEALTPSESRVAALAARGLTNREIAHSLFVTPKTIETHLAGAYRKLGIAAKSELAAVLAVG